MAQFVGQTPGADLSSFQNIGAQLASSRQAGIAQARQAAAGFLQQAQGEADKMGLNVYDYMERNPSMYKGALSTLMGGATNRVEESWQGMSQSPRTAAQILNREFYKWAQGQYETDPTLYDTYSERQIREEAQAQGLSTVDKSHEDILNELRDSATKGQWTPIAKVLGYEPLNPEEVAKDKDPVWPPEFKAIRNNFLQQVMRDPEADWDLLSPEDRKKWGAEIRAAIATNELPPMTDEALEVVINQTSNDISQIDAGSNQGSPGNLGKQTGFTEEDKTLSGAYYIAKEDINLDYIQNIVDNPNLTKFEKEEQLRNLKELALSLWKEDTTATPAQKLEAKSVFNTLVTRMPQIPADVTLNAPSSRDVPRRGSRFSDPDREPKSDRGRYLSEVRSETKEELPPLDPITRQSLDTSILGDLSRSGSAGLGNTEPTFRTEYERTRKGLATRLSEGTDRLIQQSPNILSQPMRDALAIRDQTATTNLKNAQILQSKAAAQAALQGDTGKMSDYEKEIFELNRDRYKNYLDLHTKMMTGAGEMDLENWNNLVKAYAKDIGVPEKDLVDLNNEGLFEKLFGSNEFLHIPGIGMSQSLSTGLGSGTVSYDMAMTDLVLE